jgi:hypothetical protein
MMEKYTLDEYAMMMRSNKPYLMAIEEVVGKLNYGDIDLKIEVRAGVVEKMVANSHKTWLRPKEGHPITTFVVEEFVSSKQS